MANVDESGLIEGNSYTAAVEKRAEEEGSQVVRICGALESEIAQLEPNERDEFLRDMGLSQPGLNRLIHSAYRLLDLITYFTAGVQEVRAWTIRRGTKAPGAAGVIHSDFEKGFIKADCYASDDLFKYGSEQAVKEKGLLRSEGKEYIVKDGDILFFKFNVSMRSSITQLLSVGTSNPSWNRYAHGTRTTGRCELRGIDSVSWCPFLRPFEK